MKILITGAHFTPAQAVIEEFKNTRSLSASDPIEIVYIGRKTTLEGDPTPSVESQVLPKLGVKFLPITAGRIRRSISIWTLTSFLKIPIGFIQAFYIVAKEKPNVVLSFGGYVGVPVVFSAWALSIPVILHEQTLVSGLGNIVSSFFADKIALAFERPYSFNKKKVIITGNPLREDIIHPKKVLKSEYKKLIDTAKKNKLPLLLITGGNQGSHIINKTASEIVEQLLDIACVIHQTGDSKFNDFEMLKPKASERYLIKKWISSQDLGGILREVDLAVSRAGINTLSELAYCAVPAIVIPLPFVQHDEQNVNAKYFHNLGLIEIISQDKLTGKTLLSTVKEILSNISLYKRNASKSQSLIRNDAAKRVALETTLLGENCVT